MCLFCLYNLPSKCHHFVPCWATTSQCWATRLLSFVAHWATTFQSNLVSPATPDHRYALGLKSPLNSALSTSTHHNVKTIELLPYKHNHTLTLTCFLWKNVCFIDDKYLFIKTTDIWRDGHYPMLTLWQCGALCGRGWCQYTFTILDFNHVPATFSSAQNIFCGKQSTGIRKTLRYKWPWFSGVLYLTVELSPSKPPKIYGIVKHHWDSKMANSFLKVLYIILLDDFYPPRC